MAATDDKLMTERERAEEKVRAVVEEFDRPTLALLYNSTTRWGFVSRPRTSRSGSCAGDPTARIPPTFLATRPGALGEMGNV